MPRARGRTGPAPRSSNALCATANRSAGPPTRIVVNRASGSSREVLTPIRRWIRPRPRRRRSGGRPRSPAPRRAARSPRSPPASGSGAPRATAMTSSATASAATGPAGVARRRGHPGVARRDRPGARPPSDQRGPRRTPRPRRGAAAPAAAYGLGVAALVTGGVRVRNDRHRQRERRRLGERRRAGAAHHEVRRGERRPVISSCRNGNGRYRSRRSAGSASRAGERRRVAGVAGHVDHADPLHEPRQRAPATASLIRRTACEPPNTSRIALAGPAAEPRPRASSGSMPRGRGSASR